MVDTSIYLKIIKDNAVNLSVDAIVHIDNCISCHKIEETTYLKEQVCEDATTCNIDENKELAKKHFYSKYTIHTMYPIWKASHKDKRLLLKQCYKSILDIAFKHNFKSIALPFIFEERDRAFKHEAIKVAIYTIADAIYNQAITVYFITFTEEDYTLANAILNRMYSEEDFKRHQMILNIF